MKKLFFASSAAIIVTGCASGPVRDVFEGVGLAPPTNNRTTGVEEISYAGQLEKIDLPHLLDPEHRRTNECLIAKKPLPWQNFTDNVRPYNATKLLFPDRGYTPIQKVQDLQCAFNAFYTYSKNEECYEGLGDSDSPKVSGQQKLAQCRAKQYSYSGDIARLALLDPALISRRNAIQDQILATSEKACTQFKISLNDRITKANFAFGSIATTLAGLGAIFTDPATARGLSGASAIISGVNAEHNEAYLRSLTVEVITKGIDAKRARLRDEINGRRYGTPRTLTGDSTIAISVDGAQNAKTYYAERPYISLSPYQKAEEEAQLNRLSLIDQLNAEIASLTGDSENLTATIQDDERSLEVAQANQEGNDQAEMEIAEINDKLAKARTRRDDLLSSIEKRKELLPSLQEAQNNNIINPGSGSETVNAVGMVPLSQYTAEMAIMDAFRYHAACTITDGLQEAASSVTEVRNPGTGTMQRALDQINAVQQRINTNEALIRQRELDNLKLETQIEMQRKVLEQEKSGNN